MLGKLLRFEPFGLLVVSFVLVLGLKPLYAEEVTKLAIQRLIEKRPARLLKLKGHGLSTEEIDAALARLYSKRGYAPLWIAGGSPTERAELLRAKLDASNTEGLSPEDYRTEAIAKYWDSTNREELAKLDVLLTLGLGGYIADVAEGSIEPKKLDPKLFANARDVKVDVIELVQQGIDSPDLKAFLNQIPPQHQYYDSLRPALARYREIERNGGWQPIPDGPALKPGAQDSRIPLIRKRLVVTGDLSESDLSSNLFDSELEQAVKRFQTRNHLEVDGKIGKKTLETMNVPASVRVKQIVLNMERWRWTNRELGGKQVVVNIAGYHVAGVDQARIDMLIPVIVGRTYTKTPVFSDQIEYVEFNPFWNVPDSIARGEYLPKLQKDPNALRAQGIKILQGWGDNAPEINPTSVDWSSVTKADMGKYRLRQDPGPKNALGTVKIMFPNPHNVYLHDTPNHSLFQKGERAFSHGCIRVGRPHELAAYVLGGKQKGWDKERIKDIVASGKRTVVKLEKPMPVHIIYRTALSMDDGIVRFREDVYGRDSLLAKALFGKGLG